MPIKSESFKSECCQLLASQNKDSDFELFLLRVSVFQNGGLQMVTKPNYSAQVKGWAEEQAVLRTPAHGVIQGEDTARPEKAVC